MILKEWPNETNCLLTVYPHALFLSVLLPASKVNGGFYNKQPCHLTELGAKGSLPLHTMRMEHVEPTASYVTEIPIPKQNEQKPKPTKAHVPYHHMAYSSNTIANPGMLKAWEGTETVGRRKTYGPRKPCMVGQMNELHTARSHHYLPTQPYFITNSKTEVTVWRNDLSPKGLSVFVSRRNGSLSWL